jgi:hypothetical protein
VSDISDTYDYILKNQNSYVGGGQLFYFQRLAFDLLFFVREFQTFLFRLIYLILILHFGAWRSPVAHHFGVVGVAGSNPVAPTIFAPKTKF